MARWSFGNWLIGKGLFAGAALLLAWRALGQETPSEPNADAAPLQLEVGMFSAGDRRGAVEWFQKQIESFEKAHPDIDVTTYALEAPRTFERHVEDTASLPANVVGLYNAPGYEAAYLASRAEIVPIEKFLPDPSFTFDDFYSNLLEPVKFSGKHWGVPWSANGSVLACNMELLQAAGIDTPPATWDDFFRIAPQLTLDTDGDGKVDQWAFHVKDYRDAGSLLANLLIQKGGRFADESGMRLNTPEMAMSLDMIKTIKNSEYVKFVQGLEPGQKAAMVYQQAEGLPSYSEPSKWRLSPIPHFGKDVCAASGTLFVAVRRSTPEKEAASWEFVKWVTRKDSPQPSPWGGYPTRKDVIESEEYRKIAAGSFQNLDLLYTMAGAMVEIGPSTIFGRSRAIDETAANAAYQIVFGNAPAAKTLAAADIKAAQAVQIIRPPDFNSYMLYK